MYYNHKIGILGEKIANNYLINKNYKILEKNFRYKYGEIDLITLDNITNEIVFIEVKTRCNLKYGTGGEAVNIKKQIKIINTAKRYIYLNKLEYRNIRFDVIEIYLSNQKYKINHFKNTF